MAWRALSTLNALAAAVGDFEENALPSAHVVTCGMDPKREKFLGDKPGGLLSDLPVLHQKREPAPTNDRRHEYMIESSNLNTVKYLRLGVT